MHVRNAKSLVSNTVHAFYSQIWLGSGGKSNCKFLLKNTTHLTSLHVFLPLETLDEQRRNSELMPHVFYDSAEVRIYVFIAFILVGLVFAVIIDIMETRTIQKRLRIKLCKNVRITSLGQNFLVYKKACI